MPVLFRNVAVADATGPDLRIGQALAVVDGQIEFLGPEEETPSLPAESRIFDGSGATVVPGLVDAHSHTVGPGGAHWVDRFDDPTERLRAAAEANGEMAMRAGVRWFRDVGSPRRDGRALALDVRDAWTDRGDRPYVRAAGTWIGRAGLIDMFIEAEDADGLAQAVEQQISDGADLIKLYLDGPDADTSPFTPDEIARAVTTAHAAGRPVTAHATMLPGAQAGVTAGVDCIEHGSHLDSDVVADMARLGTFLVPTLAVLASWETFGRTTSLERFTTAENRAKLVERRALAADSARMAHEAGVRIAAGSDFGGGSLRANQLAWEVEQLAAAGLQPWQALAAATWVGGDLLGEPEAGRIRPGGPADFFLVHGDPLTDPSALWRVWAPE